MRGISQVRVTRTQSVERMHRATFERKASSVLIDKTLFYVAFSPDNNGFGVYSQVLHPSQTRKSEERRGGDSPPFFEITRNVGCAYGIGTFRGKSVA